MISLGFRILLAAIAALAAACSGSGDSGHAKLRVEPASVERTQPAPPQLELLAVLVYPNPRSRLYADATFDHPAIDHLSFGSGEQNEGTVIVHYKTMGELGFGTFTGTVTIHVCYDAYCEEPIDGSPQVVPITLNIVPSGPDGQDEPEPEPEPGLTSLPVTGQVRLGHNVIDAEYSNALDRIVSVSTTPAAALFLYDLVTQSEQHVALDFLPTSVSVAPDGLTAAVGHNGAITIVDLANLEDPIVSPETFLDVSDAVSEVVLAGNGYVYAFPPEPSATEIRAIHIATNTETLGTGNKVAGGTRAKLHPSGTKIYGANARLSPDDIERYDITGGTPAYAYNSPYSTEYEECSDLWIDEGGTRIYTACGNTYLASDNEAQDMTHAGALPLMPADSGSRILSLSTSAEREEIALLEEPRPDCPSNSDPDCFTRLSLYGSDLDLVERYSLAPVDVSGRKYKQRGLFIFHSADGTTRYLISRLIGVPNAGDEFQVGEVTVTGSPPPP